MEGMLTRKDLSKKLNLSERTIDRYRKKGLPFFEFEGAIRFDEQQVKDWLKSINKNVKE